MHGYQRLTIPLDVLFAKASIGQKKEEKICPKCKKKKSINEFHKNRYSKKGVQVYCKQCIFKKRQEGKEHQRNILTTYEIDYYEKRGLKFCQICKNAKPFSEFGKCKSKKNGIATYCKFCRKEKDNSKEGKKKIYEQNQKRYAKTSKQRIEYNKIYNSLNKETVRKAKIKRKKANAKFSYFYEKLHKIEEISYDKDDNLIVKCLYCNKEFIPSYSQAASRYNAFMHIGFGESRFYCSEECKIACPIYNKKLYPADLKVATSREVSVSFRKIALEHYNHICQNCNSTENGLHVHHIDGVTQSPMLQSDIDNVRVLCRACHIKVHLKPGCTYYDYQCNL